MLKPVRRCRPWRPGYPVCPQTNANHRWLATFDGSDRLLNIYPESGTCSRVTTSSRTALSGGVGDAAVSFVLVDVRQKSGGGEFCPCHRLAMGLRQSSLAKHWRRDRGGIRRFPLLILARSAPSNTGQLHQGSASADRFRTGASRCSAKPIDRIVNEPYVCSCR